MKKLILEWLGLERTNDFLSSLVSSFTGVSEKVKELKYKIELTGIDVVKLKQEHAALFFAIYDDEGIITGLSESLDNRRQEIDGIIETLQNLDNHDVIMDLHKRILELENKGEKIKWN